MMWFLLTWLLQTSVEEWDEFNQISSPGIGGRLFLSILILTYLGKEWKILIIPEISV